MRTCTTHSLPPFIRHATPSPCTVGACVLVTCGLSVLVPYESPTLKRVLCVLFASKQSAEIEHYSLRKTKGSEYAKRMFDLQQCSTEPSAVAQQDDREE